jgi:hypothetical protein
MLNVSLSIEFMTPQAVMRANVIYANGFLRRRLGARPQLQSGLHPAAVAKVGIARGVKALGLQKSFERTLPSTFRLDAARPGALLAL